MPLISELKPDHNGLQGRYICLKELHHKVTIMDKEQYRDLLTPENFYHPQVALIRFDDGKHLGKLWAVHCTNIHVD